MNLTTDGWYVFRGGRSAHFVVGYSYDYPRTICGTLGDRVTRDVPGAPRCKACTRKVLQAGGVA